MSMISLKCRRAGAAMVLFFLHALLGSAAAAAEKTKPELVKSPDIEHISFLTAALNVSAPVPVEKKPAAPQNIAPKGIVIKLGNAEGGICFDTDTLRMAGAWTGGYLDLSRSTLNNLNSSTFPEVKGELVFTTPAGPGWSRSDDFIDPRAGKIGALPPATARYRGLHVHGDSVVLTYQIGDCAVLEKPALPRSGSQKVISRAFHLGASSSPLSLMVCDVPVAKGSVFSQGEKISTEATSGDASTQIAMLTPPTGAPTFAVVSRAPTGARWTTTANGELHLTLPARAAEANFEVLVWRGGGEAEAGEVARELSRAATPPDLPALCKGGPARWSEQLVTRGNRGQEAGAFAVDILTLPDENPWNCWMRPSAFDFFLDGRAAVATLSGDIFVVSGIDDSLEKLTWKRFATGLHDPLGLKVIDGMIYVRGRDQITRLHDLNGDGEADFYENFSNYGAIIQQWCCWVFGLEADSEGNLYYARGGNQMPRDMPDQNCLIKLSRDGKTQEAFATGFREPNGMGIGPRGEITCSDNEGHWMPASKINWIVKGHDYGYRGDPRQKTPAKPVTYPAQWDAPLCWIPKAQDNSSAGQVWVQGQKWGPLEGQMLHISYGTSSLFLVMPQEVQGQMQGGVTKFPLVFPSGIMRGRFNPVDGQLYVCGLKGWQTNASKDGTFCRVRYTNKTAHMPLALKVIANGISITFTDPLDPATAGDKENYAVEQWNYKYSKEYGSKEYLPSDPSKPGREIVDIEQVSLSTDCKTVTLMIPGIKPVMQMKIKFSIKAADQTVLAQEIYNTIHRVP